MPVLELSQPTLLYQYNEHVPVKDMLVSMLQVLHEVDHPSLAYYNHKVVNLHENDVDGEDALVEELDTILEELTPDGWRYVNGWVYGTEGGWVGWIPA